MTSSSRVGLALASVVSAVGLSATAFAPVSAAPSITPPTVHVTIYNMAFTPYSATAHLGYYLAWTNHDPFAHTSASDQGFWGSPHIAPNATWSRRFTSAGTFGYHCAIHTYMHGRVTVPMRVTPISGGGVLVWSLTAGRFDVQAELSGTTRWVGYRTGTYARSVTFMTHRLGRYLFRARTHSSTTVSGWSPAVWLYVR